MSYNANVKLIYTNNTDSSPSQYFPEIVDQQTIVIEAPAQDLNVHQYFSLFKSFLRAIDFNEYNIMDAACRLAFNDCNDEAQMKKLMNEYDLQDKQAYTDNECRALENEVRDLKAKLSRYEQPDNPQYTDEEMTAMTAEEYGVWDGLVPGSNVAIAKNCKCPVIDNAEMPDDRKWVNGDCPIHGKVK
jgi:hypothetical protein